MPLRDYQEEAVRWLVPRRRGFIQAPAGSGKTVVGAHALAQRLRAGQCAVWVGNTREQVEQAMSAIQSTAGAENCDITVCCAAAQPDTSKADVLIFDEAHHVPAATWHALTDGLKPTCVVWGLSATPFHEKDEERNEQIRSLFQEFFVIDRTRVEASGHLSRGKVYVHDLDTPGAFDDEIERAVTIETARRKRRFPRVPEFEHRRRAQWQITQETIQRNAARNQAAIQLATQEARGGQSVLVLVHSIEHGTSLVAGIPGSAIVHSKIGQRARRELVESFRMGTLPVLVATSLADEGLDVPRASRLVLVAGGRAAGKLEQRVGRVLRPFAGKEGGVIHDFMDRGALFALQQARARFRVYEKLGYEPEIVDYRDLQQAA